MGSIGNTLSLTRESYDINQDLDIENVTSLRVKDYAKDEYAAFLASSYPEGYNSGELYEYYHDSGDQAFAAVADYGKNIYLDGLGSTGGGAGTELFIRVMQHAMSQDKGLQWSADNPDSMSYYSHLGLGKYGHSVIETNPEAGSTYYIPKEDIKKVILSLRKRY